jgi:hypothetical protein
MSIPASVTMLTRVSSENRLIFPRVRSEIRGWETFNRFAASATGNPLKLNGWGLKNYLDVAHELAWISKTKDVGEVVSEYRNYVHPSKGALPWRQHFRRGCTFYNLLILLEMNEFGRGEWIRTTDLLVPN